MGSSIIAERRFWLNIDRSLLKIHVYDRLNPCIGCATIPDQLFALAKNSKIKYHNEEPDYETYGMYIYSGDVEDFPGLMKKIRTEVMEDA